MGDLLNYVFDNEISLRVKNDYMINERFQVGDYMHGRCHLFALVASEIIKAPLQAYVAPHPTFGFCLSHVFCKINANTIFDASGLWNLYSAKSKYEEPGMYLHTDGFRLKQSLLEMIEADELPSFFQNETKEIIAYIEEMKKFGCLEMLIKEDEPMISIEDVLNPKIIKKTVKRKK